MERSAFATWEWEQSYSIHMWSPALVHIRWYEHSAKLLVSVVADSSWSMVHLLYVGCCKLTKVQF